MTGAYGEDITNEQLVTPLGFTIPRPKPLVVVVLRRVLSRWRGTATRRTSGRRTSRARAPSRQSGEEPEPPLARRLPAPFPRGAR